MCQALPTELWVQRIDRGQRQARLVDTFQGAYQNGGDKEGGV